jgi:hypothetical protein
VSHSGRVGVSGVAKIPAGGNLSGHGVISRDSQRGNGDADIRRTEREAADTVDNLKFFFGGLGVIVDVVVLVVIAQVLVVFFQPNGVYALLILPYLLVIAMVATVVAVVCFTSMSPSRPPASVEEPRRPTAHLSMRGDEHEIHRSIDRQYGDQDDVQSGYWRKPSSFTLILTNRRLAVIRTDGGANAQTIYQDVKLPSITDVRAESIGKFSNLHIVRITHRVDTTGDMLQFGMRYDSSEEAGAIANEIRSALIPA